MSGCREHGCRGASSPNCGDMRSPQSQTYNLCSRALRALCGILCIGVLLVYVLNKLDPGDVAKYTRLEEELRELKSKCHSGDDGSEVHLKSDRTCLNPKNQMDEVRAIIRKELQLYASDRTGMADFAMQNLGGCIVTTRDTKPFEEKKFLGISFGPASEPQEILRPSIEPGHCWAFKGKKGSAVIKLVASIFVTHVTVEHISPVMSPSGEISSAPKVFSLWGLADPESTEKWKFGSFVYSADGHPVQTFPVHRTDKSFRFVEVVFEDNHGNSLYTCVYRVRIHGKFDKNH